jgi:AraC family transcriptional regulator of adaptative response / DNA-3-methyladenine glycosylase II
MGMDIDENLPPDGLAGDSITLDPLACYRAIETRDARFDGRLFVGVTSTGIYCRPICPARTAKFAHCRFYPSAAAAQEAGFRPCLRCRPETAPETGAWAGTSSSVARGLALIADGALDGEDASVEGLASRLGIGGRQLRRLFNQHLGASPIAVAQARRVHFAKQLIHDTDLPMTDVALAAGFGSLRRFNETFRQMYRRPPGSLRRRRAASDASGSVTLYLRYQPPYDWAAMLDFLRARAIPGLEQVADGSYSRAILIGGIAGIVTIDHHPAKASLRAHIRFPDLTALPAIVRRIRRVFDLDADVATIGAHLAQDPLLAPLVATRPGLRVPGGWDGFELAIRAILGQQVTIGAARKLAAQLVALCGSDLPPELRKGDLGRCFPSPEQVLAADLSSLGMPEARRQTLGAMAAAATADADLFQPRSSIEDTVARLCRIRGIGEWSAHYIALRVIRESDAFPASDVGLLRGATPPGGRRPAPQTLLAMSARWRPWRAYAAQHLWAADPAA